MKSPIIQPATLNKTHLLKYLRIGEGRLKKLIEHDPSFPKPVAIINKWSKEAIDKWLLEKTEGKEQNSQSQGWENFI